MRSLGKLLGLVILASGCNQAPPVDMLSDVDVSSVKLEAVVEEALAGPHTVELISLDPEMTVKPSYDPTIPRFHRWKILGRTSLSEQEAELVIRAWRAGIKLHGKPSNCFEPRHALQIRSESATIDVVICFSCQQYIVYVGDRDFRYEVMSDRPRALFDKLLKDHQLPLAPLE